MDKNTFVLQLSQEYYIPLYVYARHICEDDEMAKDIVEGVLQTACLKVNELKVCPDIKRWMYNALRNQLMERVDKKRPSDSKNEDESDI